MNFPKASNLLSSLLGIKEVEKWVEKVQNNSKFNSNSLSSLLIMPVQRIPRYILLVNEFIKHITADYFEYFDLLKCLDSLKDVCFILFLYLNIINIIIIIIIIINNN